MVVEDRATPEAVALLRAELDAIDRACSRFRADSELSGRQRARRTAAARQPAVRDRGRRGAAGSGADRRRRRPDRRVGAGRARLRPRLRGGARRSGGRRPRPPGGRLADRDARRAARACCGSTRARASTSARPRRPSRPTAPRPPSRRRPGRRRLVSLGGDVATAGPVPAGGWPVHITEDHRAGPGAPGQRIALARRRPGDVEHGRAPLAPAAATSITSSTRAPASRPRGSGAP